MSIKKYIYSGLFIGIIFSGLGISILEEDKNYSEIENKILSKLPDFNIESIKDGSYMDKMDTYVVDQFPLRVEAISIKNNLMNLIGNKEFRGIYITDNRMLEKFKFNKEIIYKNIDNMNKISKSLGIESVGMFIPNSISIYEDELSEYSITDNQQKVLEYIEEISENAFYTPYKVLKENKDKYIYFRTDHHWTQLGAKLMYEDYYDKKVNLEYKKKSDDFLGTYYSKTLLNDRFKDEIYSYEDIGKSKIEYDGISSDSLYDESKLEGKNKYQYFLNGDPAMAVIEGNGEGEVVIFKDSFAHVYIPFLTQEYSKIHVIDSRYTNMNILDYIRSHKNISKIYYIYSLSTINNDDLFAKYKNFINN